MAQKGDYHTRFKLSRITLEDQGKFLNVTGMEYFPCDMESTLMDSLLFRKDGKETPQPVKVRYVDGDAQLSENTSTCWMNLHEDGVMLKRRCDVSGEETLGLNECLVTIIPTVKSLLFCKNASKKVIS